VPLHPVPIFSEIEGSATGGFFHSSGLDKHRGVRTMSVILINPFEVPEGKEEEALAFWERVAEFMRQQPGYISTRLHGAVVGWARFRYINIAEWESVEHFENVMNSVEFKNLVGPYMTKFPHYPGLYEVIRT
jgi:heme-degrading monooxygenase HmoA